MITVPSGLPTDPRASRDAAGDGTTDLIEVRDFSFYYGGFRALEHLNLTVQDREVTALIGPSGCGKSTFLRAINRMNDTIRGVRCEGDILVAGQSVYRSGTDVADLRQRVGMVFQRPNPFPQSIMDNVGYGPRVLGLAGSKADLAERVCLALEQVGLWEELRHRLDGSALALSPGQQQRLCIARALATEPRIILMDEPCSALDPVATLAIEGLMRRLAERYCIVVVTHNMQQAARVSDRTGFFWLGRLVEFGSTNDIFTLPREKLTEDYITGRRG